jgi:hypothetical protein
VTEGNKSKGVQSSSISLVIEELFKLIGLASVPKEIQFLLIGILVAIPVGLI